VVLGGTGGRSEHRAFALLGDPDRDDGGDRDHTAGLTNLVERRIKPEVRAGGLDRSAEEGPDLLVE
jgi:hypothetical protein